MSKKRGILVWSLFGLATLLLFVSTLTIWSKRQLLDSDAWADSSSQLLANEEIRAVVSQTLVDHLFERVDVGAQLGERLPEDAQAVAPALAATLESAAVRGADRLLQSPRVQTLWKELNRRAHAGVIRLLEGEDLGRNGNVSTVDGAVTLDLRPLVVELAARLGLEDRLEADADPGAGQIVLLKPDQLGAAQTAVQAFQVLSSFLVIAAFALYALAIYLARGSRRLLLGASGASLVFVGLVIVFLIRFAGRAIVDSLVENEANKEPVSEIWRIETSVIRDLTLLLVVYGVLILLATLLAGPNRLGVAIRRWLAPTFRQRPAVVWLSALAVFLILLAWGPTAGERRLLGVAIVAALVAAGIETLRRQTLREFPDTGPPPAQQAPGTT